MWIENRWDRISKIESSFRMGRVFGLSYFKTRVCAGVDFPKP